MEYLEEMEQTEFEKWFESCSSDEKSNQLVALMINDEFGNMVKVVTGFKEIKKEVNSVNFKKLATRHGIKL